MTALLLSTVLAVFTEVTGAPPLPPVPHTVTLQDEALESLSRGVLEWYLQQGYPFASAVIYMSSPDTLTLNAVPGRHALLEAIVFPDSVRTTENILLRHMPLECGAPYDPEALTGWFQNLEDLPFILSAGPPSVTLGRGGNIVLTVPVEEAAPGYFSGDLDWGEEGGFQGGGEAVFVNLFGTGRRLELRGNSTDWGGMDAGILYREPWILGSPLSLEFTAEQQVPDSGSVTREWSGSVILDLGDFEVSGGGGVWSSYPLNSLNEEYRYGSAGLSWDLTKRVPQGSEGFSGSILTTAGDASGPDSSWILTMAEFNGGYRWFTGALGLGVNARAGGIVSGEKLYTMTTRLGGYGSLRGYPEDTWRGSSWGILSPEISLGETPTRLYAFTDAAVIETTDGGVIYPVSAGMGLRGTTGGVTFDAGAGVPLETGTSSARFYMSAGVNL